jgi:hypothetical protein
MVPAKPVQAARGPVQLTLVEAGQEVSEVGRLRGEGRHETADAGPDNLS